MLTRAKAWKATHPPRGLTELDHDIFAYMAEQGDAVFLSRAALLNRAHRAAARAAVPGAELIEADLENHPWPLSDGHKTRQFDAVLVCNYLGRPLWPSLMASVAEGGVLLYETFALGQERFGRPRRPEFLLRPGELLELCQSLQVVAYECGIDSEPPRAVQRIAAVRDTSTGSTAPTRSLK